MMIKSAPIRAALIAEHRGRGPEVVHRVVKVTMVRERLVESSRHRRAECAEAMSDGRFFEEPS